MRILIGTDGTARAIYSDTVAPMLRALGCVHTARASHVEPSEDGTWSADLAPVGGPLLEGFTTRAEALAAEAQWLLNAGIPVPHAAR